MTPHSKVQGGALAAASGSRTRPGGALAVLSSGGVESAAMLAQALKRYERVYPIYLRKGLRWETAEFAALKGFLATFRSDGLAGLTVLEVPLAQVYGPHWSLGGSGTPGFHAPDEAVYLPGRNLLLLGLAGIFCSIRRIPTLWLGVLKGNPFRDARSGYLRQVEQLLEQSTGFSLRIATPFREFTKPQVIGQWKSLPWEKTFSCLRPVQGSHCGRCQKCSERKAGFRDAGISDPTRYA